MISLENILISVFKNAGIEVGGSRPWDVQVHDDRFYRRVAVDGSLGLGDSYIERWWDCEDLAAFFERLIPARSDDGRFPGIPGVILGLKRKLFNLQGARRSKAVVDAHYDLPVHLFETMLGASMAYSCGYWHGAKSLEDAQNNKLDLVCRKLEIGPTDRVLDIGCGFGSFSKFASQVYGCSVAGVTLSGAQARYARAQCKGLPVEIHEVDYRDIRSYWDSKPFTKVVSIAMFEAVGHKNFRGFMKIVDHLLEERGSWLLHTIGDSECSADPWLLKHIFPNGELPSHRHIENSADGFFEVIDTHEFGRDYAVTLAAWEENFRRGWHDLRRLNPKIFDADFFRMWIYYLSCCRGAFLAGDLYLWHILMSKEGRAADYQPVR